jgi:hypothetical protein
MPCVIPSIDIPEFAYFVHAHPNFGQTLEEIVAADIGRACPAKKQHAVGDFHSGVCIMFGSSACTSIIILLTTRGVNTLGAFKRSESEACGRANIDLGRR